MGDNWRLEWGKAALEVLNAQRCGCWPVNAQFKLASVSWKKLFTVYFAVAEEYCSFNWVIKSQPDGSFIFCLFFLLIGRGAQKRVSFLKNGTFFFSPSDFHLPSRPVLNTSVSCLSERCH